MVPITEKRWKRSNRAIRTRIKTTILGHGWIARHVGAKPQLYPVDQVTNVQSMPGMRDGLEVADIQGRRSVGQLSARMLED